jgi:hypothetical protein
MKKQVIRGILIAFCAVFMLTIYTNCAQSFSSTPNTTSSTPTQVSSGQPNVMAISVGCGYVNEPCVTVTICGPGTTTCQTIPNVLLDTGSYGLRLFNQVSLDGFNTVTNLQALPATADPSISGNTLAECISYGDGSSDWGPLATADVILGSETAPSVPIQIINSSFATIPSGCQDPDVSPIGSSGTGFNGILGVGLFTDDCGPGCAPGAQDASSSGIYFSCPSSGTGACTGAAVAENLQTTNPVVFLPVDNNGVAMQLPSVPISYGQNDGSGTVSGYLILGIGTESNNMPSGTTTFPADGYGNFVTIFNGTTSTSSFIDSGSNALYFPAPSGLSTCSDDTSFYCPPSEMTYSATQQGATGTGSEVVSFSIGNSDDDFSTSNPNINFADLGGVMSTDFDWGLPFFFGRTIYVGVYSKSSALGSGPLWSY